MLAFCSNITASDLPDNLKQIRFDIEDLIPLGTGKAHNRTIKCQDLTIRNKLDQEQRKFAMSLEHITDKHPKMLSRMKSNWRQQIGTLGSGNHFIELCLDQEDNLWIMLHSGSRGIGNHIGHYFIELAKKDMITHHITNLPDKDLSYLSQGTEHFSDYISALFWAQNYAKVNRDIMLDLIIYALTQYFPDFHMTKCMVSCHHNYVALENHFGKNIWVTRKGAIRARYGDIGIIPGTMGNKSYIVSGSGNLDSFQSCSHGAGRKLSRSEAKKKFTKKDLEEQTIGIECRKDAGVIDEIPGAYKDIDEVMANQSDLAKILFTLKQVVNIKG